MDGPKDYSWKSGNIGPLGLNILRKVRESAQSPDTLTYSESLVQHLTRPEELRLVKTLGQFPLHLERTLA